MDKQHGKFKNFISKTKDFFLEQFHKLLGNLEDELLMAETLDEYNDIRVGVERTLVGMAQRHHLVEQYVYKEVE